jgi:hypothetical protein
MKMGLLSQRLLRDLTLCQRFLVNMLTHQWGVWRNNSYGQSHAYITMGLFWSP